MKLSILALTLSLTVVALAVDVKKEITFENRLEQLSWLDYKSTFAKTYENKAVELDRMLTFLRNKELVRKHNEAYAQGKETHWLSLNKFADLKPEEFNKRNGFKPELAKEFKGERSLKFSTIFDESNGEVMDSVDWRQKGFVSEVKDQGQCGSCWAFSATGALEGQNMRKTGKLVSLSEQKLVDCSSTPKYHNGGCGGGLMNAAFQFVIESDGLDTEMSYPYEAKNGRCRCMEKSVGGTAVYHVDVAANEAALKVAVGSLGPIAVAIDAENDFQLYGGGVFKSRICGNSAYDLDHGVLAVGYGTHAKLGDYWIVKNSWGADWGEEGYIKMARNQNNMCGIATMASFPIV